MMIIFRIFSLLPAYALSEIKSAFIISFYLFTLCCSQYGYIQRSVNVRYDDDESGNHIYTDKINSICRDGRVTMLSKDILQYFDLSINP